MHIIAAETSMLKSYETFSLTKHLPQGIASDLLGDVFLTVGVLKSKVEFVLLRKDLETLLSL